MSFGSLCSLDCKPGLIYKVGCKIYCKPPSKQANTVLESGPEIPSICTSRQPAYAALHVNN